MNVARVRLVFTRTPSGSVLGPALVCRENDIVFHVMRVESGDPFTADDCVLVAALVKDWWEGGGEIHAPARDDWPDSLTLTRVEVAPVAPTPDDDIVYPVGIAGAAGVFEGVPDLLPPQVCMAVTLDTLVDERSARGRMYFPAVWSSSSTWNALGQIPPGTQNWLAASVAQLARTIYDGYGTPGDVVLAVYSRTHSEVHPVVGFRTADRMRTQRPRTTGEETYRAFGLDGTLVL